MDISWSNPLFVILWIFGWAVVEEQRFPDGPQQPLEGLPSKEKKALVAASIERLAELSRMNFVT